MERLGRVLDNVLCERHWSYRLSLHRIFLFWEEVVGPDIAKIAVPDLIRGAVLWVTVPNSMWMQQLHLKKIAMLEKLNIRLAHEAAKNVGTAKKPVLEDIRFQIGRPEKKTSSALNLGQQEVVEHRRAPSPESERRFDILLHSIESEELRKSIKRIWLSQKRE